MMKTMMTALALAVAIGAVPALAANARHPYSNIDRRLDHGGDTGDSQVEKLNQQQLDAANAANGRVPAPMPLQPMMPMQPMSR